MIVLYIKREFDKTIVKTTEKKLVINEIPKRFIDNLCIENLSTFAGRYFSTKKKLEIKSLVPIFVDDKNLLFPTKSIRDYDCIWINYYKIKKVLKTKIIFHNLLELKISDKIIKKQIAKCEKVLFHKLSINQQFDILLKSGGKYEKDY